LGRIYLFPILIHPVQLPVASLSRCTGILFYITDPAFPPTAPPNKVPGLVSIYKVGLHPKYLSVKSFQLLTLLPVISASLPNP